MTRKSNIWVTICTYAQRSLYPRKLVTSPQRGGGVSALSLLLIPNPLTYVPKSRLQLALLRKKLEGLKHRVSGFETLKLILLFLATQTLIFSFMENFSFCRNKNNNYCSIMDSHKLIIPFIIKMKLKAHGNLHPFLWGPGCREVYLMTIPKSSPIVSRDTLAWLQQKFSRILVYNVGHVQKNRQFIKSLSHTHTITYLFKVVGMAINTAVSDLILDRTLCFLEVRNTIIVV